MWILSCYPPKITDDPHRLHSTLAPSGCGVNAADGMLICSESTWDPDERVKPRRSMQSQVAPPPNHPNRGGKPIKTITFEREEVSNLLHRPDLGRCPSSNRWCFSTAGHAVIFMMLFCGLTVMGPYGLRKVGLGAVLRGFRVCRMPFCAGEWSSTCTF